MAILLLDRSNENLNRLCSSLQEHARESAITTTDREHARTLLQQEDSGIAEVSFYGRLMKPALALQHLS